MKRNKTSQNRNNETTKHARREACARTYLAGLNIDFYQSFGKVCVYGRVYPDYQSAARAYDPEWWRK